MKSIFTNQEFASLLNEYKRYLQYGQEDINYDVIAKLKKLWVDGCFTNFQKEAFRNAKKEYQERIESEARPKKAINKTENSNSSIDISYQEDYSVQIEEPIDFNKVVLQDKRTSQVTYNVNLSHPTYKEFKNELYEDRICPSCGKPINDNGQCGCS